MTRLLLTTDTAGGVWTYAMELARELANEGVEIVLACLGAPPRPHQILEADAVSGLELHVLKCRLPWMSDPWDDVAAAGRWLIALQDRTSPDVVHLNEPVFGSLDWKVPTVVVGHSCVLSWWDAVRGSPAPAEWTRYADAMRAGLAGATVVVAPSHWMLEELRRFYGVQRGRAIPNGRDPAAFEPGGKEPFVLTATRIWDPAKNAGALDLASAGLAWPAYAAGEARPPEAEQPATIRHLRVLGQLSPSALAHWLTRAAIFALPAKYEPFGLSTLEAGLSGCALVLGDIPSLRETWDGAALFVDPDDHYALRAALDTLIENPERCCNLGARARERALGFSPTRMALAYLDLYRRLSTEVQACAS
jgi:glycogen synthase